MNKPLSEKKINKCSRCKKPMPNMPGSRDYTNLCSECFAKSFVEGIFK